MLTSARFTSRSSGPGWRTPIVLHGETLSPSYSESHPPGSLEPVGIRLTGHMGRVTTRTTCRLAPFTGFCRCRRTALRRQPARSAQRVGERLASSPDNPKRFRYKDAPCFDPSQSLCHTRNFRSGAFRQKDLRRGGRRNGDHGFSECAIYPLPRFFGAKNRSAYVAFAFCSEAGRFCRPPPSSFADLRSWQRLHSG